ncbi:MAG TPA: spore coat protein [Firmicutes bacterium]|jgi:spore coat protein CotF|nr:spore coat protein [Bacillota bacterium]
MRPNPNSNRLSDKAICIDCLNNEKYITSVLNSHASESASPQLRQIYIDLNRSCHQNEERIFSFMQQRGWYQVQSADPQQVHQTRSEFQPVGTQQQVPGYQSPVGYGQPSGIPQSGHWRH